MKEVLKKMKIKCSKKLKKTHLSDGAYNLLIEAIVLYGLLINLITCAFFADYVAMIPLRALVIGYLLISIIGIVMLTRYKAVLVKFVGYNMIVIPCGITLSTIISDYAGRSDLVLQALIITTMITFCMITLSCTFPKFFVGIGKMLFVALVGVVIAYVVCYFVGLNTGIIAWISAIIFSLYIGYDFVSAQQAKHTVANAIIYGADIYLDLVNLFVEILRILKDND